MAVHDPLYIHAFEAGEVVKHRNVQMIQGGGVLAMEAIFQVELGMHTAFSVFMAVVVVPVIVMAVIVMAVIVVPVIIVPVIIVPVVVVPVIIVAVIVMPVIIVAVVIVIVNVDILAAHFGQLFGHQFHIFQRAVGGGSQAEHVLGRQQLFFGFQQECLVIGVTRKMLETDHVVGRALQHYIHMIMVDCHQQLCGPVYVRAKLANVVTVTVVPMVVVPVVIMAMVIVVMSNQRGGQQAGSQYGGGQCAGLESRVCHDDLLMYVCLVE